MINIDATTPQLTLVKGLFDAYLTLDINKIAPFISKNYTFQTLPKIPDLPDEATGGHLERYGALLSLMNGMEITCHEVIEAPGKVVLQASGVCHTVDGNDLEYESLTILTIVEEDGELKVGDFKDFSNPEKRGKLHGWFAKALAEGAPQIA